MAIALSATVSALILIAWIADLNARRAAWRRIAQARRDATHRDTHSVASEHCPYCHPTGSSRLPDRRPADVGGHD